MLLCVVCSQVPDHEVVEGRGGHACGDRLARCKCIARSRAPTWLTDSRSQILSLPSVFATLGMVAGIFLVIVSILLDAPCRDD